MVEVTGPGGWVFRVGSDFQMIDNGDSIQAMAGDRVVYLSALRVGGIDMPRLPAELRQSAWRSPRAAARLTHNGDGVEGEAEIRRDNHSYSLYGFMYAPGAVATCVITFASRADAEWAESVWRSLARMR